MRKRSMFYWLKVVAAYCVVGAGAVCAAAFIVGGAALLFAVIVAAIAEGWSEKNQQGVYGIIGGIVLIALTCLWVFCIEWLKENDN